MRIPLVCCEKCEYYFRCIRKWALGERGLEDECCISCKFFYSCMEENRRARWNKLKEFEKN